MGRNRPQPPANYEDLVRKRYAVLYPILRRYDTHDNADRLARKWSDVQARIILRGMNLTAPPQSDQPGRWQRKQLDQLED